MGCHFLLCSYTSLFHSLYIVIDTNYIFIYRFLSHRCDFFMLLVYLLIFGYAGSLLLAGFSLVVERGVYSLARCSGFLWWWLLLQSTGSEAHGLQ